MLGKKTAKKCRTSRGVRGTRSVGVRFVAIDARVGEKSVLGGVLEPKKRRLTISDWQYGDLQGNERGSGTKRKKRSVGVGRQKSISHVEGREKELLSQIMRKGRLQK